MSAELSAVRGGGFPAGDGEAEAVIRHAAALSNADRAATVTVTGLNDAGLVHDYELLLGPASRIIVADSEITGGLPDATGLIAELEQRIADLE